MLEQLIILFDCRTHSHYTVVMTNCLKEINQEFKPVWGHCYVTQATNLKAYHPTHTLTVFHLSWMDIFKTLSSSSSSATILCFSSSRASSLLRARASSNSSSSLVMWPRPLVEGPELSDLLEEERISISSPLEADRCRCWGGRGSPGCLILGAWYWSRSLPSPFLLK